MILITWLNKLWVLVRGWFGFTVRVEEFNSLPSELKNHLVLYYKMNDTADNTNVIDSSGNGYDGTSVPVNTVDLHTTGKINGGFEFNGVDEYVDTGRTFQDTFRDSFSIGMWVRLKDGVPTGGKEDDFFGAGHTDYYSGHIELWNVGIKTYFFHSSVGGTLYVTLTNTFTDGQQDWHYMTVVVERVDDEYSSAKIYLDAVKIGDTGNTYCQLSEFLLDRNFQIGLANLAGGPSPLRCFNGDMDGFMLFDKALSQDEIDYLYNDGDGREDFMEEFSVLINIPEDWGW